MGRVCIHLYIRVLNVQEANYNIRADQLEAEECSSGGRQELIDAYGRVIQGSFLFAHHHSGISLAHTHAHIGAHILLPSPPTYSVLILLPPCSSPPAWIFMIGT